MGVSYKGGNIILFPDIETDYVDFETEKPIIRLYHNNGFDTGVSSIEQLVGKKFIWNSSENEKGEEAGRLYVFEHEDITKGTIEIIDFIDNSFSIRWSGTANIFFNELYYKNVPFETNFTTQIKKYSITRDSVCLGDDITPLHKATIDIGTSSSYMNLFKNIVSSGYLPSIKGNDVIWVLVHDNNDLVSYSTSSNKYHELCEETLINPQWEDFHIKYFSSPDGGREKFEKYLNSKNK